MKKGLLINESKMGKYEIEKGFVSYKTICDYYIGDMVLCNNIIEIDPSVWDNMQISEMAEYSEEYPEIFQYYLCHLTEWEEEDAKKAGLLLSYSNKLDCDVLCVTHWGTSWDYVLTDVKLFDNWEDLENYEKGMK